MPTNQRRKLIQLDVTDAEKRRFPSKHYSYVIKVTWNDDSQTIIYRRYSKFFDFQIILLETFPSEGGLKDPSARIIPFLPGKILFRRSHIRDVAMKRLKPIDEYCKALVRLPPHISECAHVLDFFETKEEDLNPIREEGSRRRKKDDQEPVGDSNSELSPETPDIGEISGPLLLEQYVAVADYTSTQKKELTITTGQHLEVIEKNENGWWFVSNDEGERGWVPGVYLEKPDGSVEDLVTNQAEPGQGEHYVSIHAHTAENADEVTFSVGVIVEVLQKNLEGWWLVRYNGKEGYAPASYLEKSIDRRPVQIISSIRELKHRHSLPLNNLSSTAPRVFGSSNNSSSSSISSSAEVHSDSSDTRPDIPLPSVKKTVQPPPKRSSIKRTVKKRPDGPPPLPPTITQEPAYEYMTVAPFNAEIPDGVSFGEEKKVDVLEKSPGGWWYINIDGNEGWAPASYIEKREKPQVLKVIPPCRPGPPKLMKNNSTGSLGAGSKPALPKVPEKSLVNQSAPFRMNPPNSFKSQSVMSPAKRPLPPLPMSGEPTEEPYEEVGSNIPPTIEEEVPNLVAPPLPPNPNKKPLQDRHVGKTTELATVNKSDSSGPVDFRSVLKSSIAAKHNEIKKRSSESPPRPPTKPGLPTTAKTKAKPDGLGHKPKIEIAKEKPTFPQKSTSTRPGVQSNRSNSPSNVNRANKAKIQPDAAPSLPPKPKSSFTGKSTRQGSRKASDDGAVVDFRSVLRSTQRKESTSSNGVGRSKSFNADKVNSISVKSQQNKPPMLPKKPANMPLRPPVPAKMKGLENTSTKGASHATKPSGIKKPAAKPSWTAGKNKPVLQRFQSNNSNSNNLTSEKKQEFTVGHLQIVLTNSSELSAALAKRGSPDGQVDEKFTDQMKNETSILAPPEPLKKMTNIQNTSLVSEMSALCNDEAKESDNILYRAMTDYHGEEECEISFVTGEKATVIERAENNWWYVEIGNRAGWAPCTFFCPDSELTLNVNPINLPTTIEADFGNASQEEDQAYQESYYSEIDVAAEQIPGEYRAAADFEAADSTMLSLSAGDRVTVTQQAEGGWWYAILRNGIGEGWVPSTYLDPL